MAKEKRFEKIYTQGGLSGVEIWVDTQTGVQYLHTFNGSGGGTTVLVDRDGKPLLYHAPPQAPEL